VSWVDLGLAHLSESDFACILFPSDNARLLLLEGLNMAGSVGLLATFYTPV
jgi:spore maturation protein SpmB